MADGRAARRERDWKRIVTKCVDSVRLPSYSQIVLRAGGIKQMRRRKEKSTVLSTRLKGRKERLRQWKRLNATLMFAGTLYGFPRHDVGSSSIEPLDQRA